MTNGESICYRALSAMVDDVEVLSLVKECRDLEEIYGSDFTSQILILQLAHMYSRKHKEDKPLQLKNASKFCHLNAIYC